MARDFTSRASDALPDNRFHNEFPEQEFSTDSLIRQASQDRPEVSESDIDSAMDLSAFDL